MFAPDRYLGAYVAQQTGRELVLWPGSCEVHETFSKRKLVELKVLHPGAVVTAHPECPEQLLQHADHIGSTSAILAFARSAPEREIIVVTEPGILHQMQKENPDKVLIPVPGEEESCNCNECPYMKLNTLEKLYLCMRNRAPEVTVSAELREQAASSAQQAPPPAPGPPEPAESAPAEQPATEPRWRAIYRRLRSGRR